MCAKRLIIRNPLGPPATEAKRKSETVPAAAAPRDGKAAGDGSRGAATNRGSGPAQGVPVPSPQKATQPIVPSARPRPPAPIREFKFLCVFCGKKLAAPESMAGRSTKCPECRNVIVIPPPSSGPWTPEQKGLGVRYRKAITFKFHCIRCGQGLEAERSTSGTQAFCPMCHSRIAIPSPADE